MTLDNALGNEQTESHAHGFKVCGVSSMEPHICTVVRKPTWVCSHLNRVGLAKWRTLAATRGDRNRRTRRLMCTQRGDLRTASQTTIGA